MRPERASRYILAITRSKAKMYEYDVPPEHHIQLTHPPDILLSLAVGLLGDAAAAIADMSTDARREETPPEAITFAGTYFDAYLQSRLENYAEGEFPILASACFYLADNPGSSKVLANQATEPAPHLGSGLALLTYKLLRGDYTEMLECPYADAANNVLAQLSAYLAGTGALEPPLTPPLRSASTPTKRATDARFFTQIFPRPSFGEKLRRQRRPFCRGHLVCRLKRGSLS